MKNLLSFLLLFFTLSIPFPCLIKAQCMLHEIGLSQRINVSSFVVEGKVIEKRSFWDDNQHNIFTANKIEVYKLFKGQLSTEYIEILTLGGVVGLQMQKDYPSLQLEIGEIGIFLLKENQVHIEQNRNAELPVYQPTTGPQGFIRYNLNEGSARDPFNIYENISEDLFDLIKDITGQKINNVKQFTLDKYLNQSTVNRVMSITSFSPSTVTAGTDVVLTISGSGFGSTQGSGVVEFSNADNGGSTINVEAIQDEYCSWSDTEIKVHVPADACTGNFEVIPDGGGTLTSASALTVNYSQLNVSWPSSNATNTYQTQHINDDGNGGYNWQQNTAFANGDAAAPFLRALETWCNATGIYWVLGPNTASSTVANDGINIVTFDITTTLPSGVLGRCTSRWSGCGTGNTKDCETGSGTPAFQWYVSELDISFNDDFTWHYSTSLPPFNPTSAYDFESVAVHELGHGHQLGHILPSSAVMYYAIANNTAKRNLSSGEISGATDVYNRSTTSVVCGQTLMSTGVNCSAIGLPVEYISFSAKKKNEKVLLSWQTASEYNNAYFELERSIDGRNFESLGSVKGAGNSHELLDYSFMDTSPRIGINYYRLKQIDYDGKYEYSELRSVIFDSEKDIISLYPNPILNTELTIQFFNEIDQLLYLEVLDINGKKIKSQNLSQNIGNNILRVSFSDIPSGVYWVLLKSEEGLDIRRRIVKLN